MLRLLFGEAEVLLSRNHTNGVGVAHTAAPSLDTDNGVALVDNTELETVVDSPLEAAVDILLPDLDVEVGLLLREVEGPHTTVQVGVLEKLLAWKPSSDLEECSLTREAVSLRVTMRMGHTGRYLESRRAVFPLQSVSVHADFQRKLGGNGHTWW